MGIMILLYSPAVVKNIPGGVHIILQSNLRGKLQFLRYPTKINAHLVLIVLYVSLLNMIS